jgi:dTDP-4-dehydrorhamnose 3,5-epimerase
MELTLEPTPLPGVHVLRHGLFRDERGFFQEVYRGDQFAALGLPASFAQVNHSRSARGVVRGLHFQWEPPMGKLMRVIAGEAFLVAVDVRKGSPTLGKWFGATLAAGDGRQVWAPAGCARGFAVLSESAEIEYLCTGIYNPRAESGIRWDDPAIGIEWPVETPTLSAKDRDAQTLAEWLARPESDAAPFRFAAGDAG